MITVAPNIINALKKYKEEQGSSHVLLARLEFIGENQAGKTFDIIFEAAETFAVDKTFEQDGVNFVISLSDSNHLVGKRLDFHNGQFMCLNKTSEVEPSV
jgi:Fe-S cluster assembly iron-binding protein IscA